jgi:ATP-binding cassette subfamily B multidrug efflux pump
MTPYRILIPYLRPGIFPLTVGICLLVLVDFLQLLIPRFIKGAVDALSAGRATAGTLIRTLVLILGVCYGGG